MVLFPSFFFSDTPETPLGLESTVIWDQGFDYNGLLKVETLARLRSVDPLDPKQDCTSK